MWFYPNLDREHSLDGEFKSTSNKYPFGILLMYLTPRKTRNTWKNVVLTSSSHFFMYFLFFVERSPPKYAKWVLVGCGIEFPIQPVLQIKIWIKPHEDKLKIRVEKVVFLLVYFFTTLTIYSTFLFFYSKKWWFIPYGWHHHLESYWFL